jgi:hypothetical protein
VKRVLTAEEIMDLQEQQRHHHHQQQPIEEEFYDYIFPDDEKKPMGMAFLEKALAWKQQLASVGDKEDSSLLGKRGRDDEEEQHQQEATADKNAIDLDL